MPRGRPQEIDRDLLHAYLWRKAIKGQIKVNARHLAKDLQVNYTYLTTILKQMADQGRLKRIGFGNNGISVYSVTDPDVFKWLR